MSTVSPPPSPRSHHILNSSPLQVEGEDMDRALADYAQLAPVAKAAANVTKEKEVGGRGPMCRRSATIAQLILSPCMHSCTYLVQELEQLAGLLNEEDTDYEMAALARAERA